MAVVVPSNQLLTDLRKVKFNEWWNLESQKATSNQQ